MSATAVDSNGRAKWSLALSLLIGPLSWTVFFIVGYLVAEAACIVGGLERNVAGYNLVVVVVVALGLVASAVAAWGALWSHRRWRASGAEPDDTEALQPFLARAATLINILFLLGTLMTAAGMLFILPCQWT